MWVYFFGSWARVFAGSCRIFVVALFGASAAALPLQGLSPGRAKQIAVDVRETTARNTCTLTLTKLCYRVTQKDGKSAGAIALGIVCFATKPLEQTTSKCAIIISIHTRIAIRRTSKNKIITD